MSTGRVVVVDYGMGNVLSVCRAIEHCGGNAKLSAAPADIASAERLVLPGVGAFADCIDALRQRNLIEPILDFVGSERPLLGICVGMQILLERGEEFGGSMGFDIIPGTVVRILADKADGSLRKIPHIGWTAVTPPECMGADYWAGTIFDATEPNTSFYFVHSFTAVPADSTHLLAVAHYQDFAVTAAVHRGNVTGCQFHPEKSGEKGLRLFDQFLRS